MKKLSKFQIKQLRYIDDCGWCCGWRTFNILLSKGLVERTDLPLDECGPPWQLTSAGREVLASLDKK